MYYLLRDITIYGKKLYDISTSHYCFNDFSAGHGYCLEDTPQKANLLDTEPSSVSENGQPKQPGEKFSENQQCQLVFGSQSKLCSYMVKLFK